eukprot:6430648-Prymnesium_polylepis.1
MRLGLPFSTKGRLFLDVTVTKVASALHPPAPLTHTPARRDRHQGRECPPPTGAQTLHVTVEIPHPPLHYPYMAGGASHAPLCHLQPAHRPGARRLHPALQFCALLPYAVRPRHLGQAQGPLHHPRHVIRS